MNPQNLSDGSCLYGRAGIATGPKRLFAATIAAVFTLAAGCESRVGSELPERSTRLTLLRLAEEQSRRSCPSDKALRRKLESLRDDAAIPGVAVAVIAEGRVVFREGFGFTDVNRRVRVRPDTPFRLASVTKPFVGVALMRAVELGRIALDDRAEVDNPNLVDEQITVQELANHTSGIRDSDSYLCAYHTADRRSYLDDDLQAHCPAPPITELAPFLAAYLHPNGVLYDPANFASGALAAPGATHVYSNVGVAALGQTMEQALGASLQGFVAEHVLKPLRMRDTAWDREALPRPNRAALPHVRIDGAVEPFADYRFATWPDGGLWSSADDLSRLLRMVLNGGELDGVRVLQASSVARMLQPDVSDIDGIPGLGYGLLWERYGALAGHGGADIGALAQVVIDPKSQSGAVILANADSLLSDSEWPAAFDAIAGEVLEYAQACSGAAQAE
jgi:CubicO group peptidase (beta-lactamase class C family)